MESLEAHFDAFSRQLRALQSEVAAATSSSSEAQQQAAGAADAAAALEQQVRSVDVLGGKTGPQTVDVR